MDGHHRLLRKWSVEVGKPLTGIHLGPTHLTHEAVGIELNQDELGVDVEVAFGRANHLASGREVHEALGCQRRRMELTSLGQSVDIAGCSNVEQAAIVGIGG